MSIVRTTVISPILNKLTKHNINNLTSIFNYNYKKCYFTSTTTNIDLPLPSSLSATIDHTVTSTFPISSLSTSRCVAYSIARHFDLSKIDRLFDGSSKYERKHRKSYIHINIKDNVYKVINEEEIVVKENIEMEKKENVLNNSADIFFFSHGTYVSWNTTSEQDLYILNKLKTLKLNFIDIEQENYLYRLGNIYDIDLKQDILVLKHDDIVSKLSFSFSLAGSVHLNSNEALLDKIIEELPSLLNNKHHSKASIAKVLDQLYIVKLSNISIMEVPDYFWDNPSKEKLHELAHRYCATTPRIKTLNERIDHVKGVITTLMDELKHEHSIRLERIIIALICMEVFFGLYDHLG